MYVVWRIDLPAESNDNKLAYLANLLTTEGVSHAQVTKTPGLHEDGL